MRLRAVILSFFAITTFVAILITQNCGFVNFASNVASDNPANCPTTFNPQTGLCTQTIKQGPGGPEAVKAVLSFGIVTKNMACVMCHTNVTGDVSGFGTMTFRDDSFGFIKGHIYAADLKNQKWKWDSVNKTFILDDSYIDADSDPNLIASALPSLIDFNLVQLPNQTYKVKPGEIHNVIPGISFLNGGAIYTLTNNDSTIRDLAKQNLVFNPFTGQPIIQESDFPTLDSASCVAKTSGKITAQNGVYISPLGNSIFVNGRRVSKPPPSTADDAFNDFDPACPPGKTLKIEGEVVVQGDLILSGCITGQGTIYATGNIYIPDDIKMKSGAFPFTESLDSEERRAAAEANADKDMLSLGADKFIVIGSMSEHSMGVFTHPQQDPIFKDNVSTIENIFSWLGSGTKDENKSVYQRAFLKRIFKKSKDDSTWLLNERGAVALVEANLYANQGVAAALVGEVNSNIKINGSVLTPNFALLATAFKYSQFDISGVSSKRNPFNGLLYVETQYLTGGSQINQDYRLKYLSKGYECHRIRTIN